MTTRAKIVPTIFLLFFPITYFLWLLLYSSDQWVTSIVTSSIFVLLGFICLMFLWWRIKDPNEVKTFWFFLRIGILLYLISNVYWLISILTFGSLVYPNFSYLFWTLSYFFYLLALFYLIKELDSSRVSKDYYFNLVIFMICAIAVSIHYLIKPIVTLSNHDVIFTIISLSFPILGLGILFLLIRLYYILRFKGSFKKYSLLVLAFGIQILGDSVFGYQSIYGTYQIGSTSDVLWLTSYSLIGVFTFYYSHTSTKARRGIDDSVGFLYLEKIFPYIVISLLLLLLVHSYNWAFNALSFGFTIIFILIITRMYIINNRNESLLKEYSYLAYHDQLTGLYNRASFISDLYGLIERPALRGIEKNMAIFLLDLDGFKKVNDTLGHFTGDILLKMVAQRLRSVLDEKIRIYRLGGDEFLILIPNIDEKQSETIAKTVLQQFGSPFVFEHHELTITPSIGISLYPEHGKDSEALVKAADVAMYHAKEKGKNNFHFFNSDLNRTFSRKIVIETELRKAIENNEFILFYQPKVNLKTGKIVGIEALIRWTHPKLGSISPVEFIPIAEETGMIVDIGEWVLRTACKQIKLWHEKGLPEMKVSVNASLRQFQLGSFPRLVEETLELIGISPDLLEIEITESIMQNVNETIPVLKSLRALGVKVSIDDFGTGYSSLYVLKELPIDIIKIDKSFLDDINDYKKRSVVKSILDIGNNLGLEVVAEGIENVKQIDLLLKYHCMVGQGYYFSKPIPADEVEVLINSNSMTSYL